MLIVAIPKSASTSLMVSLSKLHNLPAEQLFFKDQEALDEFPVLSQYHSDIRALDTDQLSQLDNNNQIFKQHIAPTTQHLKALNDIPKVVLLRKPEDIIRAYYRAEAKLIHDKRKEFEGIKSESDWMNQAQKIGLIDEVRLFYDRWKNATGNQITVSYEGLISDPSVVINQIESYFNLNITKRKIQLSKERYSRVSQGTALLAFLKRSILSGLKRFKK